MCTKFLLLNTNSLTPIIFSLHMKHCVDFLFYVSVPIYSSDIDITCRITRNEKHLEYRFDSVLR
jgi:hypothetical protein